MEAQKVRLSDEIVQAKAREYANMLDITDLSFSNGWLHAFKQRYGFQKWRIFGESEDAQIQNIDEEIEWIKERIRAYALSDVYNMDETGLYPSLAPDSTIARHQIEGAKKNKTRLSIAFTCNADGSDRFEPLIIGHAAKPRCFKKRTGEQLGFFYRSNSKA